MPMETPLGSIGHLLLPPQWVLVDSVERWILCADVRMLAAASLARCKLQSGLPLSAHPEYLDDLIAVRILAVCCRYFDLKRQSTLVAWEDVLTLPAWVPSVASRVTSAARRLLHLARDAVPWLQDVQLADLIVRSWYSQ